ncbi:hypothetical protein PPN31114_03964 [Pandoraea pneumonica]|uniref:Uncharacterized protein n=1 Tax=Pandoraea pneumonica TaxID=2508299 RepID=A0A5E4XL08_9BURK|nr:hypothetical protein PPN31114_03964 [Pandoraea pneumonica]
MLQHLPTHFLLTIPFLHSNGYFVWTIQAMYSRGPGAIIEGSAGYFSREDALQDAIRFFSTLATGCPMIDESGERYYSVRPDRRLSLDIQRGTHRK